MITYRLKNYLPDHMLTNTNYNEQLCKNLYGMMIQRAVVDDQGLKKGLFVQNSN